MTIDNQLNFKVIICILIIITNIFNSKGIIIAVHDARVKSEIVLTDIGKVIDYLSRHGY